MPNEVASLRRRVRHPGLQALVDQSREAYRAGTISFEQAAQVRLGARRRPQELIDNLEELRAVHIEGTQPDNAAIADWTPDDWSNFIGSIFELVMKNLPALLGICA